MIGDEKGDDMMHDPARNRFTRMRPGQQHNDGQVRLAFLYLLKIGNG